MGICVGRNHKKGGKKNAGKLVLTSLFDAKKNTERYIRFALSLPEKKC